MSEENVEVVRRTFAAWNAGDMDALRELHDPDVIVRAPKGWPEPGPFVGREAFMRNRADARTWDAELELSATSLMPATGCGQVRLAWRRPRP